MKSSKKLNGVGRLSSLFTAAEVNGFVLQNMIHHEAVCRDGCTAADIARWLGVTKPTAVKIAESMYAAGLIYPEWRGNKRIFSVKAIVYRDKSISGAAYNSYEIVRSKLWGV